MDLDPAVVWLEERSFRLIDLLTVKETPAADKQEFWDELEAIDIRSHSGYDREIVELLDEIWVENDYMGPEYEDEDGFFLYNPDFHPFESTAQWPKPAHGWDLDAATPATLVEFDGQLYESTHDELVRILDAATLNSGDAGDVVVGDVEAPSKTQSNN